MNKFNLALRRIRRTRPLAWLLVITAVSALLVGCRPKPLTVTGYESLGAVSFPTGTAFADTEVGGLSAITYDAAQDVYIVLSDDRSQVNPARYYEVAIDLSDGRLDEGDVTFTDVIFLRDPAGATFAEDAVDPEGIALLRSGFVFVSTEGDSAGSPPIDPFVDRFNSAGQQDQALDVPNKFLPDGTETVGVRDNHGFESLTATPDEQVLFTATEVALAQDGPPPTLTASSPARLLSYHLPGTQPGSEYVYAVSPIPRPAEHAGGSADNGLVDLQAIDNAGSLLAMERSFAEGVGNTVRVFAASTAGATDVSGFDSLRGTSYTPVHKELVFDFAENLGVTPDNIEGMTFGPDLPDGRKTLIFVSDNNFNPSQITQFVAVAVELAPAN